MQAVHVPSRRYRVAAVVSLLPALIGAVLLLVVIFPR